MKILITGGGGREHALAWKLSASSDVDEIICAPGNGGIAKHARCVNVSAEDVQGQIDLAKKENVGLVIVGPEVPLVNGLVDKLEAIGIAAFGPSAKAAQLEGSKSFSKKFMQRHGIPTAKFTAHTHIKDAIAEIKRRNGPCVIKADGLAAGKGVIVCTNQQEATLAAQEILGKNKFGDAGQSIIIEDFLQGEEASILAICDGKNVIPLIAAQDHKAAYDKDTGPNTGGMGAYAPAPVVTEKIKQEVTEKVLQRTVNGMAQDGIPFKGILYAGIMICNNELFVLEYNVRFGDPECQPIMALMDTDLLPILMAATKGELADQKINWHDGAALCVVLAAGGYPDAYEKGHEILGLDDANKTKDIVVFHAGTKKVDGKMITNGGRVLGVTSVAKNLSTAAQNAYEAANKISWKKMRMRSDIGHKAL